MKKLLNIIIVLVLTLSMFGTSTLINASAKVNPEIKSEKHKDEKDRYIIGLEANVDSDSFANKHLKGKNNKKIKGKNAIVTDLSQGEIDSLKKDDDINYIEVDANVSIEESNKPNIKVKQKDKNEDIETWGNTAIGADLAHINKYSGKKVKIALLDTGVSEHPELKVKEGVSFVDGVNSFSDDNGHGTHVAGIISAQKDKSGIVGVAPDAEIYPVKVLDKEGTGSYSQVIDGIEWAIEKNVDIISMSFGGTIFSQSLYDEIKKAYDHGIIIVAAAGNSGYGEETELYPARYPEVVSVGAVSKYFSRANFSSTGSSLDIMAPGTDIYSLTNDGGYVSKSGTSMAVPFVTGSAALLLSSDKKLTNKEVVEKLYSTSTPLGNSNEYGKGLINVAKALGVIDHTIQNPYENNKVVDNNFDIRTVDSKLDSLSQKLANLKENALSLGNLALAKDIEAKYNNLIIKNSKLHQLPDSLLNKKENSTLDTAINEYYRDKNNLFLSLINEYNQAIEEFNHSKPLELSSYENGVAGVYNFTISPGGSQSMNMNVGDTDYYNFTASSSGTMTASLSVPSNADYDLQVLTSNDVVLGTSAAGTGQSESVSFSVTAGSSYKVKVYYYSGATGSYTVSLSNITPSIASIYLNSPVDISLSSGEYRVYSFTPSSSGNYQLFTGPYGGFGGPNDTYLELYSNSSLTNMIASDDDSNGNTFSKIKTYLTAGTTYFLKVRHYSSTGSLYTRLTVQVDVPPTQPIYSDSPIDVNVNANEYRTFSFTPTETGKYRFYTTPYGDGDTSSDTFLELYSNSNLTNILAFDDDSNGQSFSEIFYELTAGTTYYIKFRGYNNNASLGRLEVNQTFDWEYTDYTDDNSSLSEYYIKDNTYSTSTTQEAYAVESGLQTSYVLQEGDWKYVGIIKDSSLNQYGSVNQSSVSVQSFNFKYIKKITTQVKDAIFNKLMNYLGLPSDAFNDPTEIEYFQKGISVAIDDNVFFGLIDRFKGLSKYPDDFYYLEGYQITSEAILAFYIKTSYSSAAQSAKSFLTASTIATSGLIISASGGVVVGGIVEVGALSNVIKGSISAGISYVTGNMATRSVNLIKANDAKLTKVKQPSYNGSNYRKKFSEEVSNPSPESPRDYDAHHMFPQKKSLKDKFDEILKDYPGTIHNPKFLSWWKKSPHRSAARAYNQEWTDFFKSKPTATVSDIFEFGRYLANKYDLKIRF
ncbi:S8 family serine peptidase [Bacillus sp. RG28]|uniref:S8 family serine peptidase n=1 Tax=Gottfriedia endophytica TaxID=2820819 RepID=A0A940NTL9_9BACI|nr:S8 family serine peptidase [Gottfriedia endophytica]MBP0726862.1 S8 family serine peptidase [Gottfriedia endophytica]